MSILGLEQNSVEFWTILVFVGIWILWNSQYYFQYSFSTKCHILPNNSRIVRGGENLLVPGLQFLLWWRLTVGTRSQLSLMFLVPIWLEQIYYCGSLQVFLQLCKLGTLKFAFDKLEQSQTTEFITLFKILRVVFLFNCIKCKW